MQAMNQHDNAKKSLDDNAFIQNKSWAICFGCTSNFI